MIECVNKYIYKYRWIIIFVFSILGLIWRFYSLDSGGGDYDGFLSKWCEYLRDNGGFRGIASVETDYNAAYLYFLAFISYIPVKDLYLIKIFSFVFDYILAFAVYKLVELFIADKTKFLPIIAFCVVILMPTVVMNSSEWVQCDSIYVAFLFLSLYCMLKKKYDLCFILYGISISFKLQAIFLLPVYGIIFLKNKDFSIFKFLWVIAINVLLYIPAIILGRPVLSVFDAYFTQVGHYSYKTVLGYPNVYYFFSQENTSLIRKGILFTLILLLSILVFVLKGKEKLDNRAIIELSMMILFLMPYFLPEMHDRYGYAAEVLSVVYFLISRKDYVIWLLINVNAVKAYDSFLHGVPENLMIRSAILQFIIVCYFVYVFVNSRIKMENNNENIPAYL